MQMRRLGLMGVTALAFAFCANAAIIADHPADYTTLVPTTGWSYLTNTGGAIGDDSNYTPLFWNSTVSAYAYAATGSWGWSGRYTYLRNDRIHPGPGGAIPEYAILAYTVQPGEEGGGNLTGYIIGDDLSGLSDGWDLRIYVGNSLISAATIGWSAAPQLFTAQLGTLVSGDTVYVALGPNGDHSYDRAVLGFQVETPEPGSLALVGGGAILLGLLRFRRR